MDAGLLEVFCSTFWPSESTRFLLFFKIFFFRLMNLNSTLMKISIQDSPMVDFLLIWEKHAEVPAHFFQKIKVNAAPLPKHLCH